MDNIYSQEFLYYYKNPSHKGKLVGVKSSKVTNLSCGDAIEVFIELDDGKVKQARFDGVGCIVSLASAELLCETLEGKSLPELEVFEEKNFLDQLGFELTPSRQKCALIGFKAFKKSLNDK